MLTKTYNGHTIRWRESDKYGYLTDMAKATNKRVNNFLRLDSTDEYVSLLESVTLKSATELVQVVQGGTPEEQGTWADRRICIRFAQWCSPHFALQVDNWIEELLTHGYVDIRDVQPVLQPVSEDTIKTYTDSVRYFEGNNDLQLAQLLKNKLGNLLLQDLQNNDQQLEIPQYEGAVDVAIRLGYRVPSNYESSLGNHVRKTCEHLIIGKNKRYSNASAKQVPANMYPAFDPEVEDAVIGYCLKKGFRQNPNHLRLLA